ncbi:2-oxo acid dehydrogenase subunit E2 [Buchnera aphidicola]|uniref:2-oxo acid dehydrogenase subunit E2 n=1 Tax=Buchnera aphidicola TaxID=9 RepID=UPI00094C3923|nr:2-oxo acid dehydrogenase subunit E2 [Buchnera aphidicola]
MDIEILTPDIGIEKVEVTEILVQEGIKVNKEDGIVSVESKKSVLEIPSPYSGIVKKIYVQVGDILMLNTLIMTLTSSQDMPNKTVLIKPNIFKKNSENFLKNINEKNYSQKNLDYVQKIEKIYASPNVRRASKLLKINLLNITGSGRKGRIIIDDLYAYQKKNIKQNVLNLEKESIFLTESKKKCNEINFLEINQIQQETGKNLLNTWNSVPHVTQFNEADITNLDKFRKDYNERSLQKNNQYKNLSIFPFIIKCVENSLYNFPKFNSFLSSCGKKIILKKNINIGIAVDTDYGLLVPVLKNLHDKSISCIALELNDLVLKAKNNQLHISDMQEGSFTISNLGSFGGTGFTPIINVPEVCILGVSKAIIKPVWKQKKFLPRLVLPFSISYDHRVINGADAVRFTTFIVNLLEDIRNLII